MLKYITQILFCIVILIPKGMSGKHSLKVPSKLDIVITNKLQIETLKFVHNSCCFTVPELVLSDQLNPDNNIFRTNLLRTTKFRTNLLPNHFKSGKITKLPVLIWSGVRCFTAYLIFPKSTLAAHHARPFRVIKSFLLSEKREPVSI